MKKSLPHLVVLTVMFVITIGVVLLTKAPYANAFLNEAEAIVITFCAFLAVDILRWIICMMECYDKNAVEKPPRMK